MLVPEVRRGQDDRPGPEVGVSWRHAAEFDTLLRSMADMLPEALDSLSGEERHGLYGMLRIEVAPMPEGFQVSSALGDIFRRFGPRGRSTKPIELRFCALVTEDDTRVRFYREGFGKLKEDLL